MPFDIEVFKKLFFDRKDVRDALTTARRRALSKFGAFVRTGARRSIRKRKGISKPGSPPSSHVGLLRQFILFGYDPGPESVVIGPTQLNSKSGAPELLEEGGTVQRAVKGGGVKTLFYRARPYMAPAFKAELPKAAQMFKDALRK